MKTKWGIVAIALSMVFSCHLFAKQEYTLIVKGQTVKKDTLPMYNLFYLSKQLNLPNYSKEPNYKLYNAINYHRGEREVDPSKHASIDKFMQGITNYEIEIARNTLTRLKEGNFEEFKNVQDLIPNINEIEKKYQDLKILENLNNENKPKYSQSEVDNLEKSNILIKGVFDKKATDSLVIQKDSLKKHLDSVASNFNVNADKFSKEFARRFVEENKSEKDSYNKNFSSTPGLEKAVQQQITINAQIQAAHAQSSSGISIPSQSQMIEAMAIFLAKRAKQEAAIWFMDQVRMKMNNPMVLDVFPETIKVLESNETYKVPTFNTTWKYALAKDFVEMPKNLTESPWVREVIIKDPNKHAMLSQSVNFGYDLNRLMTEQHHYRDIIKYFYINPREEKNDEGQKEANQQVNQLINNSATLLYIITNEFFAIDHIDKKEVYRLLTYEEIAGLSTQEFQILLELIDLKYGHKLEGKILPFKAKKEEVSKWMGNILFSLSQFDKIRNEYQTKKEEIKEDLAAKNFYNVWSILSQMTDNLYNEELFKLLPPDKKVKIT